MMGSEEECSVTFKLVKMMGSEEECSVTFELVKMMASEEEANRSRVYSHPAVGRTRNH